jgi:APA family basic amino acid/polyamine antiporter
MAEPSPTSPVAGSSNELPRTLRLRDAIAVVVGSMIGSGIFVKEGTIAKEIGGFGPILAVWLFVGIVTWCGALAVSELASMLPRAGGPYVYLRAAYGPLPAFVWGWTEFWIIRTGSIGSLACASVLYLEKLVPITHLQQGVIAGLIVIALAVVNIRGVRGAAAVQNIATLIKVGFLLVLILGPWLLAKVDYRNLAPLEPPNWGFSFWKSVGAAMIAIMWAYDGWITLGSVAEEVKEPQRNIPFALSAGLGIVIALYVAAVLSYHLVLPFAAVAGESRVAAATSAVLFGPMGPQIAAVCVIISALGACNANMLAGPRIYFALARDGLLPKAVSRIHPRYETPANAVILQTIWTLILIAAVFVLRRPSKGGNVGQAFDDLTDFVIFGGQMFYAMAVGAVFVLRRTSPDLNRPYRTLWYPWTPAIYLTAFIAALLSMLVEKPGPSAAGGVLIVAGAIYYFWIARRGAHC